MSLQRKILRWIFGVMMVLPELYKTTIYYAYGRFKSPKLIDWEKIDAWADK